MLIKECFDTPANFYREIASRLQDRLDAAQSVQAAINLLPEKQRGEFLENFTDTLIYEHIGGYLLKSLVSIYKADEVHFLRKCATIYEISRTDRTHFNRKF